MNNLSATGAKLQADRTITLDAANNLTLQAAENNSSVDGRQSASSNMLGVTVGFGQQSGISFQVAASRMQGKQNGSESAFDNTLVTAGQRVSTKSGQDTTLKGAQLGAPAVTAQVGGNLNVETLQDKSQYEAR